MVILLLMKVNQIIINQINNNLIIKQSIDLYIVLNYIFIILFIEFFKIIYIYNYLDQIIQVDFNTQIIIQICWNSGHVIC